MASTELYEPAAREGHASSSVDGRVYVWGGLTQDSSEDALSSIQQFDPYLEVWSQLNTAGTPHSASDSTACTSFRGRMYMYGGYNIEKDIFEGVLSCLNLNTLTWSQLSPAGGPMRKIGCGIVHFHHDKLAVIGGHGLPTGPTQPGSTFIKNTMFTDGKGWTNEIHVFDISQGIATLHNLNIIIVDL